MKFTSLPALILIDIQKGLDDLEYYGGARNNPYAEESAAVLLEYWRKMGYPLFHVKHNGIPPSPLRLGAPGNEIKEIVRPEEGETVIEKETNSAFLNTPLHDMIQKNGITDLVLAGLTTAHCVSSTARMAGNLGYNTYVISDASATFDTLGPDGEKFEAEMVHRISLANLHREFATVIDSKTLFTLF